MISFLHLLVIVSRDFVRNEKEEICERNQSYCLRLRKQRKYSSQAGFRPAGGILHKPAEKAACHMVRSFLYPWNDIYLYSEGGTMTQYNM